MYCVWGRSFSPTPPVDKTLMILNTRSLSVLEISCEMYASYCGKFNITERFLIIFSD